jgi:hypothetical protein
MRSIDFLLVVLVITALVLGGTTYWLYNESIRLELNVKKAKKDLELMERDAPEIKHSPKVEAGAETGDTAFYLLNKISAIGLQTKIPAPKSPKTVGAWLEELYAIQITPQPAQTITRSSIVTMLDEIERERPYLRTKSIDLTFKKDAVQGTVTIARFMKKP